MDSGTSKNTHHLHAQGQAAKQKIFLIILTTWLITARSKLWECRRGILLYSHTGDTPCTSIGIDAIHKYYLNIKNTEDYCTSHFNISKSLTGTTSVQLGCSGQFLSEGQRREE